MYMHFSTDCWIIVILTTTTNGTDDDDDENYRTQKQKEVEIYRKKERCTHIRTLWPNTQQHSTARSGTAQYSTIQCHIIRFRSQIKRSERVRQSSKHTWVASKLYVYAECTYAVSAPLIVLYQSNSKSNIMNDPNVASSEWKIKHYQGKHWAAWPKKREDKNLYELRAN